MGLGTFVISFYYCNGRELKWPWNDDEDVDMDEDGGQDESAMDNDGEQDEDVDKESHENYSGRTQSDLSGDDDASRATTGDIDLAIQLREINLRIRMQI